MAPGCLGGKKQANRDSDHIVDNIFKGNFTLACGCYFDTDADKVTPFLEKLFHHESRLFLHDNTPYHNEKKSIFPEVRVIFEAKCRPV